jgi:hypothetical protein
LKLVSNLVNTSGNDKTYRDEKVRATSLILLPSITILLLATLDITTGTMHNHETKENRVEPRERRVEAGDHTPTESKVHVASVMDLASVLVPTIAEEGVASVGLDLLGVLDGLPGKLGKGLAVELVATLLSTEHVLLRVTSVPYPVGEEVAGKEPDKDRPGVRVKLGVVVGKEDGAVAVRQWYTCQVPEDEHETPLLVVHVPSGGNHLLTLAAGIGIQEVSHEQESHLTSDVAVLFVLTSAASESDKEQDKPRQTDLEEHLEIEPAKHTRVQFSTHEEIVNVVTSHSVLSATHESRDVGDDRDNEARQDSD